MPACRFGCCRRRNFAAFLPSFLPTYSMYVYRSPLLLLLLLVVVVVVRINEPGCCPCRQTANSNSMSGKQWKCGRTYTHDDRQTVRRYGIDILVPRRSTVHTHTPHSASAGRREGKSKARAGQLAGADADADVCACSVRRRPLFVISRFGYIKQLAS